jgi:hypothetical protein
VRHVHEDVGAQRRCLEVVQVGGFHRSFPCIQAERGTKASRSSPSRSVVSMPMVASVDGPRAHRHRTNA